MATVALEIVGRDSTGRMFSRVGGALGNLGRVALGVGTAGLAAMGAGFAATSVAGVKFNMTLENVEAQMFAFLKDGTAVADTMDMIRDRAARTPFALEEMATAAASLIPASKQSGEALEGLIETAEILAASNPAEGLEGAAFALREALSGDFTSIIERFNLPRQRLKELREEGIPDIEAVRIAMQELGLDTELVSNLSETMGGRWSTFLDTMQGIAGTLSKPIFDFLKRQLEELQPKMEAVADAVGEFMMRLTEEGDPAAEAIGGLAQRLLEIFGMDMGRAKEFGDAITNFLDNMGQFGRTAYDAISTFKLAWDGDWKDDESILPLHRAVGLFATRLKEELPEAIERVREMAGSSDEWREAGENLIGPLRDLWGAIRELGRYLGEASPKGEEFSGWLTNPDNWSFAAGLESLQQLIQSLRDIVTWVTNALRALDDLYIKIQNLPLLNLGAYDPGSLGGLGPIAPNIQPGGPGVSPGINAPGIGSGGGIGTPRPSNPGMDQRGTTINVYPSNALDVEELAYNVAGYIQARAF